MRLEHAHLPRREPAVDELAVPGVLGRVHRQHEIAAAFETAVVVGGSFEADDAAALLMRRERLRVPSDGDDVRVLREDPEAGTAGLRVLVHRRLVPQEREPLVRYAIREPVAVQKVDVAQLHQCCSPSEGSPSEARRRGPGG